MTMKSTGIRRDCAIIGPVTDPNALQAAAVWDRTKSAKTLARICFRRCLRSHLRRVDRCRVRSLHSSAREARCSPAICSAISSRCRHCRNPIFDCSISIPNDSGHRKSWRGKWPPLRTNPGTRATRHRDFISASHNHDLRQVRRSYPFSGNSLPDYQILNNTPYPL